MPTIRGGSSRVSGGSSDSGSGGSDSSGSSGSSGGSDSGGSSGSDSSGDSGNGGSGRDNDSNVSGSGGSGQHVTRGRCACGFVAAIALLALAACSTTPLHELRGEGLGSTWSVKIAGPRRLGIDQIRAGIQQRVDEVAHTMSRWDATSALSALNASTSGEWQPVPPALFTPLRYAFQLAEATGGAYDPTVTPLVDAWGFGVQGRRYSPPSPADLDAARARVGWSRIGIDPDAARVRKPAGMQIDLSSLQHGFGADQVAAWLRSQRVSRFIVDVGSEIRAEGDAPTGQPWHVAIESPPDEPAAPPQRVVALRAAGIATSGNYRYYFDYNGRRYSHRIDPRTSQPIDHPLLSVTVIDPECLHADALATALTVLGPDAGFEFAQRNHIAAYFIVRTEHGLEERMTPAFTAWLAPG